MPSSSFTLVAACVAAVAAIINVIITKGGTSSLERQKWRRQEAGPIGARLIVNVHGLVDAVQAVSIGQTILGQVSDHRRERASRETAAERGKAAKLYDEIEIAVAQLDLIAGQEVRGRTTDLLGVIEDWCKPLIHNRKSAEALSEAECIDEIRNLCLQVHGTLFNLVTAMRKDFGAEPKRRLRFSLSRRKRSVELTVDQVLA